MWRQVITSKEVITNSFLVIRPITAKFYPLGLNLGMTPEGKFQKSLIENSKDFIKNNNFVSKFYDKKSFNSKDFEFLPIPHKKTKILLITRVWDPDDESSDNLKAERELINKNRVSYIKPVKKNLETSFQECFKKTVFQSNVQVS